MKKEFYLQIPEPCHENWNAMTPVEHGRFCASCAKQVVDFTEMADREVLNILTKTSGNTCGRFTSDQLNKPLIEEVSSSLKPYKFFLSAFIPAFLFTGKVFSQGSVKGDTIMYHKPVLQPLPPQMMGSIAFFVPTIKGSITLPDGKPAASAEVKIKSTQLVVKSDAYGRFNIEFPNGIKKLTLQVNKAGYELYEVVVVKDDIKPLHVKLSKKPEDVIVFGGMVRMTYKVLEQTVTQNAVEGKVVNENGEPLSYASIKETSTNKMVVTDSAGKFSLPINSAAASTEILVSSVGYEPLTSKVDRSKTDTLFITMKPTKLGEVVVVSYPVECRLSGLVGGVSVVQKLTVADTITRYVAKVFRNEMFKVYPNPALKSSNVHITFKEAGAYNIQLLDNSGKLYLAKELKVDAKQTSTIELPSNISAGQFYIKAINAKSRKQFVDKIIIQ